MSIDPLVLFETKARGLDRRGLEAFARRLRDEVTEGRAFCCLVTTDAELERLNREFRSKPEPTDVLSFPAPAPHGDLGDVAISADRAREQAAELGHDTPTEIRVLMLHGVLHLLGHDHESDGGKMKRLETAWRKKLELPAGLIERARARKSAGKPAKKP